MKIQLYLFMVFAVIVMAWSVSPLWAQDKTAPASVWQNWDVTLGAGASYEAVSPGVDDYIVSALPYVDITYQDRYFLNVQKGLGAYVYKGDAGEGSLLGEIALGAALGYDQGRKADDFEERTELQGLGDLDGSLEGKVFLEAEVGLFDISVDFAQGLSSDGHDGWYSNVGLSYDKMLGRKFYFSVGQSLRFSNADFQQAYYGVDAGQSRATGLRQYSPGSGLESTSFEVVGRYFLSKNWSLLAKAEHRYLLGDAADSPFVDQKSQVQGLFALTYQF